MKNLLQSYNQHGAFMKTRYFVQAYGKLPSTLRLDLPMAERKANMEAALRALDTERFGLKLIYKEWTTASNRASGRDEDFASEYFFQSPNRALCASLDLTFSSLSLLLLYDPEEEEVERWALSMVRRMRSRFGEERKPVFNVLTRDGNYFTTESIEIGKVEVDITKTYNDDFLEVHQAIQAAMGEERSGLILLHGAPGTGKTSYIKSLVGAHPKRQFIFIPNDFVAELLQPNFVSFLIARKNAVLVIEDAEKVIASRDAAPGHSVVSTILQLTDGLFSDYLNIKVVCTFNTSIDRIDQALLRKGRMIAYYEFGPLALDKTNALLRSLGHEGSAQAMTLAEIFHVERTDFGERRHGKPIGFFPS